MSQIMGFVFEEILFFPRPLFLCQPSESRNLTIDPHILGSHLYLTPQNVVPYVKFGCESEKLT